MPIVLYRDLNMKLEFCPECHAVLKDYNEGLGCSECGYIESAPGFPTLGGCCVIFLLTFIVVILLEVFVNANR